MRFRRLSLSTMTAITITTMLVFAVAMIYYGVSWYADNIQERAIAGLSPGAAKAFSDIDRGVMPDLQQFQALPTFCPMYRAQAMTSSSHRCSSSGWPACCCAVCSAISFPGALPRHCRN